MACWKPSPATISPDVPSGPRNFALCLSDAGFSRAVMEALRQREFLPRLVVLPEYAPATYAKSPALVRAPGRELDDRIDDLPLFYAPRDAQQDFAARLRAQNIAFLLVACWPYRLDLEVIDAVSTAALNLHPSLLPRYRGADPVGAQLCRGDTDFGISLHLLDAEFDHGDLVAQATFSMNPDQLNRHAIEARAAALGADLFIEALRVGAGRWELRRQDSLPATD